MRKLLFGIITLSVMVFMCFFETSAANIYVPEIIGTKAFSGEIRLFWDGSEDETNSVIYRKKVGEKKSRKIGNTEKNSYSDKNVEIGTEYIYYIKISGKKSEPISAVTYIPERVTGVTGKHSGKKNYILLQWEKADGADIYQVYRNETKNGKYKFIGKTKTEKFEDTSVENGKVYYYKIRGVNKQKTKQKGIFSVKTKVGSFGKTNITVCDGMVYALKRVTVRKKPSVSSKSLAILKKGYSIVRTGESDTGWTRVIFNGKTGYIKSRYLTEERIIVKNKDTGRIIVNPEQELWNLVVVNSSREMTESYKPVLKEVFNTGKMLDERVVPYYEEMCRAARKDGVILESLSGYRSYERQKELFDERTREYMSTYGYSRKTAEKKAARVNLPPGTSEHNLGIAMDIGYLSQDFRNSAQYRWLEENAHKYGFILRYTKEKIHITGIVDEPWHWRFVGTEYAEEIKNSGLCLEEFLDEKGIDY